MPEYVSILRIQGPFLFGTTDKLAEETADLSKFAPIVVLRLRNMTAIDATGLHALETLAERLKESGRTLLLCGASCSSRARCCTVPSSSSTSARTTSCRTSTPRSSAPALLRPTRRGSR